MVKNYKNKKGLFCDELTNLVPSMIKKAKLTIDFIIKEILGEQYGEIEIHHSQKYQPYR